MILLTSIKIILLVIKEREKKKEKRELSTSDFIKKHASNDQPNLPNTSKSTLVLFLMLKSKNQIKYIRFGV